MRPWLGLQGEVDQDEGEFICGVLLLHLLQVGLQRSQRELTVADPQLKQIVGGSLQFELLIEVPNDATQVASFVSLRRYGTEFAFGLEDSDAADDGLDAVGGQSCLQMAPGVIDSKPLQRFGEELAAGGIRTTLASSDKALISALEL